ncbi:MAG: putative peptidoglycan glycosyltransferase FtsW [Chloroflexota bacterium]
MSAVTPVMRTGVRPASHPRPTPRVEQTLQRERHDPEYGILVAIVALAALGILMVYSSSAMRAYLQKDDTFAIVGPQILWGALGIVAMVVTMRLDYRLLRLVALPLYLVGLAALVLVFVPQLNVVVGGSARWLKIGPLPAVHPAEFMKLAVVVYLAYWFEKRGTGVRKFWSGTVPFILLAGPVVALVLLEPDMGTASVLAGTSVIMFFLAGANVLHLLLMAAAGIPVVFYKFMHGYQMDRINAWLDPFSVSAGDGYHSVQGFLALALGGIFGAGLGESRLAGGLFVPNASNDFIFAIIGEEFGLIGAGLVILLFAAVAYLGIRTSLGAPDTFGALLAAGITGWICIQAFINIGVVVGLIPVTGIPLPFVSAGGSSLVVAFAAVGILLSVSRETVEKGTWNDAPADRGRRNRRARLPGSGRRPVASRSTRAG